MKTMFTTALRQYLAPRETTFMMLACGALVEKEESRRDLFEAAQKYIILLPVSLARSNHTSSLHVNDLVAFSATGLQPSLTVPFFFDYAQHVLFEGFRLSGAFPSILVAVSASLLSRHTNLVNIFSNGNSETLEYCFTKYCYSHQDFHPFGHCMPISCPKCKSLWSWAKVLKNTEASTVTYMLCCTGITQSKGKGSKRVEQHYKHVLHFKCPEGFQVFGHRSDKGRWMRREVTI